MTQRNDRIASRMPRHWRVSLLALLTAGALAVGGTAWAYWTATATGTGSVATKSVAITETNFSGLAALYQNHALTSTGNFTVANTGQTTGTVSISIAAPASGLGADLPIRVWAVASAAACTSSTTVPPSAMTGTWASFTSTGTITMSAGQNQMYCVRTTAKSRQALADTSGTQSTIPVLTVTLQDSAGWDGDATDTASNTQATQLIYPYPSINSANFVQTGLSNWFTIRSASNANLCLDDSNSGGAGTHVITWTCHSYPNQRWEILPTGGSTSNLVRLRGKSETTLDTRLSVNPTNGLLIATTDTGATEQLWEFQRISTNEFQLVAAGTGLCLTMKGSSVDSQIGVSQCSTSASARANQVLVLDREPLTFTNGSTVRFEFDGANTGASSYRIQQFSGGTWVNRGTATNTYDTQVEMSRSSIPSGSSQWRIVINGTASVVYDNIRLSRTLNTVTATSGVG